MSNEDKLIKAFLAFTSVMKDLDENYTIKQSFKAYGRKQNRSTVTFLNKTFSDIGDNSLTNALTAAIKYIVFNFSKFESLKAEWIKKDEEDKEFCNPVRYDFQFIKYID